MTILDLLSDLIDAQDMAMGYPGNFSAPATHSLGRVAAGRLVKICRNDERFWVLVKKVSDDDVVGEVNNHLLYNPDLPVGTMVRFQKRHIFSVFED